MPPRILILRAPGTNCDVETAHAFEVAGGAPTTLHLNRLLEQPGQLADYQVVCIPGGFSYGDDVAAGRIFGNQIQHRLTGHLREFRDAGKLILGVCNGFQVLAKSGVLFDDAADSADPAATLTWNDSGRFEARWVRLGVRPSNCVFFAGIESMYLPIAHAEGKFVPRNDEVLSRFERAGQLVLRYEPVANDAGASAAPLGFPDNPNGSIANVAGVCDPTGRVCGLMPHPERHIDRTHHPRWARGEGKAEGDGLRVFKNAVAYFG